MQSQKHGFIFENEIRTKVFNLNSTENDTNKYDIPCNKNQLNKNENISIKVTGNNTICCGDILRFYDYDFNNINTIILIKYKQESNLKIVKNIYEINYNKECHKLLFGDLPLDILKEYIFNVKNIPKNIKTREAKTHFNYISEKKKIQKEYNLKIQINPKVDSSTQRRVQCSITNFETLLKDFITYKSTDDKPICRDKEIISQIESNKRIRKKKK